jgi:dextranase
MMRLLDLYPRKGTYRPGEPITLEARFDDEVKGGGELVVTCNHLAEQVASVRIPFSIEEGIETVPVTLDLRSLDPGGYGMTASAMDTGGNASGEVSSAFDIQESWVSYPRYGFLTDFETDRDTESALRWLARYHINGLQFYDWQYRHDQLLSTDSTYTDPLGRELSLDTVTHLIDSAHEHGIAAMAYLTVYAASLTFAESHPGWRLFDESGQPCNFEDFLGLMDPSPGSPWIDHLLNQCEQTLDGLPFDGLHVDQYGDPKIGYNAQGDAIDLPAAFQAYIRACKVHFPTSKVTFNAVGNWPIESLAASLQDFVYIEIWPETPRYKDVLDIVQGGRMGSGGKPVVIAQYIPVDHEANIRLSDALIFALGGSRIELGEQGRLLCDPYFPKHQAIPEPFQVVLRRYYDFVVRYSDLVCPTAEISDAGEVELPEGVLPILRRSDRWTALHVINFTGLEDARWCEAHPMPTEVEYLEISLPIEGNVKGVWVATPDKEALNLVDIPWREQEGRLEFALSDLMYWTMIAIETDK